MSRSSFSEPESPVASVEGETTMTSASSRASLVESFRACGIAGARLDKEYLRRRITIPHRLLAAIAEAIQSRNPGATAAAAAVEEVGAHGPSLGNDDVPEAPMVVFVNSRSGGRHGPVLKNRLQELMGEEQVFDLSTVKPSEFIQYGLACLEKLADLGDDCAKGTREKLRIMVAGGDGTVGWVLGCLGELFVQNREPVPPIGIIPLGTGNDLSRSFGWDGDIEGEVPKKVSCFEGVFYNYFSIGMDAQVAYGFHHLRDERPYLAHGPITNKTGKHVLGMSTFSTSCQQPIGTIWRCGALLMDLEPLPRKTS
ncbi:putative Diacylglycerol kinase 4 [Cocos nucifera]|uniref:diacylglycerol kinase (ATP) n=1 Tax=Cocos nucifera TaxID=13894 RepID=A0A8K0HV64_COCNU|nr:putative Diacylglycerol kinase 4 [Cocos nucifera]